MRLKIYIKIRSGHFLVCFGFLLTVIAIYVDQLISLILLAGLKSIKTGLIKKSI